MGALKLRPQYLIFWVLLLAACSFRNEKFDPKAEEEKLSKAVKAEFTSLNQYIFQPKCARCHSEPTQNNHYIVLTDYTSIVNSSAFPPLVVPGKPEQSSLYTSVRDGRMPKGPEKLPDHVKNMLYEWIEAGAPREGNSPDPPPCNGDDPNCGDDDPPPDCEPDEPGCDEDPICQPDEPGCEDDDEWE